MRSRQTRSRSAPGISGRPSLAARSPVAAGASSSSSGRPTRRLVARPRSARSRSGARPSLPPAPTTGAGRARSTRWRRSPAWSARKRRCSGRSAGPPPPPRRGTARRRRSRPSARTRTSPSDYCCHEGIMSEDKLQRDIVRGAKAQVLLQNELLQESFGKLEAEYIAAWRITPARYTDARERLWQAVNIVGLIKEHIAKVVADGKLAQRQLDELIKQSAASRPR